MKAALSRLVDNYEHSQPHPVTVEEIPEKTFQENFRGIVGFEIKIEEIQAAYKLSQNRDEVSYHSIIGHLEEGDDTTKGVALEMKKKTNFDA